MSPPKHRVRHRFSPDIQARVKAIIANSRDNWHWIIAMLWISFLIGATISLPYLLQESFGWFETYLFVSLPLLGCWQRALATIMHECSRPHQTFAKNSALNFLCGVVAGYPILQSWSAYSKSHTDHHVYLWDVHRDPDLQFQKLLGTLRQQSPFRFAMLFLVSPLFTVTPRKVVDLVKRRLLTRPDTTVELVEQIACLLWFFGWTAAFVCLGVGYEFFLFWVLPLLTSYPTVGHYIELAEHVGVTDEPSDELQMSRNRWTNPITHFLSAQFNEHLHLTHHLFPTCPWWALPKLHDVLMEDADYRAAQLRDAGWIIPLIRGVPSIMGNILNWVRRRQTQSEA